MTNKQIEALKREVIGVNGFCDIDSFVSVSDIAAIVSATIDHLHSQNRLLADGCVGVPEVPTQAMIDAAGNREIDTSVGCYCDIYRAMITAAQTEKREGE